MPQVVIENPILNSPFAEPNRHFRFGKQGITDEIVAGRRESSYFIPIPQARKKTQQHTPPTPASTLNFSPTWFIMAALIFVGLILARRFGFGGKP